MNIVNQKAMTNSRQKIIVTWSKLVEEMVEDKFKIYLGIETKCFDNEFLTELSEREVARVMWDLL